MRKYRYLAVPALLLLSGCHLVPDKPRIEFGKVYVGTSVSDSVRFTNNHGSEGADVGGYSASSPYSVAGTPEVIPVRGTGAAVTVTFAPTAAGSFSGEVRPGVVNAMEIQVTAADLRGEGVYAKNEGVFSLENRPASSSGSFTFGSTPIQPGQPIDWGVKKLGDPATEAEFRVRNAGAHVQGAMAKLRRGDQHFEVSNPNSSPFDIFPNTTRNIAVRFKPEAIGEFWDIIEVWDSAAPANKAGILLKAKVTD